MSLKNTTEIIINISEELHKFLHEENNERWNRFVPPPTEEEIKLWEMKIREQLQNIMGGKDVYWDRCPFPLLDRVKN